MPDLRGLDDLRGLADLVGLTDLRGLADLGGLDDLRGLGDLRGLDDLMGLSQPIWLTSGDWLTLGDYCGGRGRSKGAVKGEREREGGEIFSGRSDLWSQARDRAPSLTPHSPGAPRHRGL